MRLIYSDSESMDRQRRVLLLSKRLDELAAARCELLLQLEDLDAQAGAVRLERNTLHNMDAPISILPDDVLAMIFEEGTHPRVRNSRPQHAPFDFGVLVSHVIQRWRHVSVATPKLWTSIWCIADEDDDSPPYPEGRAATFLSRARSLPLDIYIEGFRKKDFSSNFLQLLSDHTGHCRHLRMDAEDGGLTKALKCISLQPMPILESIDLRNQGGTLDHELIFRSGVPRLTTARIVDIDFPTMHRCLSAFSTLSSLQLTCIYLPVYNEFRAALMTLPSLRHLELCLVKFNIPSPPTHLPILLSNILHLHVEGNAPKSPHSLGNLLSCIQAPNLVALSLSMSRDAYPIALNVHAFEPHFPSLQHLVLPNVSRSATDIIAFARSFPHIGRLTFTPLIYTHLSPHDLDEILGIIVRGAGDGASAANNAPSGVLWPKLQSIALPTITDHSDVPGLKSTILQLQAAGHPIRKLLLPEKGHSRMVEVGTIIEIEKYYVDWPTPFNR